MERRGDRRLLVEIPGHYQIPGNRSRYIFFSQISAGGCRVTEEESPLEPGQLIALHLGPVGPLEASVRWKRDNMVGVQFSVPLESAIVEFFAAYCQRAA
jgi:hypothetical protein